MKYEPRVDRPRLVETVREVYGLPAEALTFVPVGFATACYVLHCAGDERFFLKLWPDTDTARWGAARLPVTLPLVRTLHERTLVPRAPYPIPTRNGALSARLMGMPFAIFPFLPGSGAPEVLPAALQDELARTVAAIHASTAALDGLLPPGERFEVEYEPDLRRSLAAVERIRPSERPGLRALRDLILPRREEIAGQLARLHSLRRAVRRLDGPLVLCHTDLGGDNLLVDEDGRLSVLDWDGATVAPPEHDLQSGLGGDFPRFLTVYQGAGGARPLHVDHFAFYLLRRYLADLTARLVRILEEETTAEEDEDLLYGMTAFGFDRWAALDVRLAEIATAVESVAR